MSDNITRTTVEENDSKITKLQVQNEYNDKLIRKQVRGLHEGHEPVIESLNVTENGTYTVEEGTDGFNPVVVNVPEPPAKNTIVSQIKVNNGSIRDVKRGSMAISGNQVEVVSNNIHFKNDKNANLVCNVSQINKVAYCLEIDVVNWDLSLYTWGASGDDRASNYLSLFTFGTNKSTLWGLFFDVGSISNVRSENDTSLRFRCQTNTETTISTGSEFEPESLNGKTIKLYLNCGLDNNNKISYYENEFVLTIDDVVVGNGDFSNYSGTNWDQMCNIGWSSYNWGSYGLTISEYRCRILSELM